MKKNLIDPRKEKKKKKEDKDRKIENENTRDEKHQEALSGNLFSLHRSILRFYEAVDWQRASHGEENSRARARVSMGCE